MLLTTFFEKKKLLSLCFETGHHLLLSPMMFASGFLVPPPRTPTMMPIHFCMDVPRIEYFCYVQRMFFLEESSYRNSFHCLSPSLILFLSENSSHSFIHSRVAVETDDADNSAVIIASKTRIETSSDGGQYLWTDTSGFYQDDNGLYVMYLPSIIYNHPVKQIG